MLHLSPQTARSFRIRAQFPDAISSTKAGALRVIERLGYLQIDSINVIQRAHHHILWSRQPAYTPDFLHNLHYPDRAICEAWTHAAALIPMKDLRYYWPRLGYIYGRIPAEVWIEANRPLVDHVLDRIRAEGPLRAADFDLDHKRKGTGWWDWKPAKHALEHLLAVGRVMVRERRNFQRVYDLPERVLPSEIDLTPPSPEEKERFIARCLLRSKGIINQKRSAWPARTSPALLSALRTLVEEDEAVEATVEGIPGEKYFAARPCLEEQGPAPGAIQILSPFDPLLDTQLFAFESKLEAYTPAPKRRWGYFALPILWGTTVVGRMDAKADRGK